MNASSSTVSPRPRQPKPSPDEEVVVRARELYAQYAEQTRGEAAETRAPQGPRRRASARTARANQRAASRHAAPTHAEVELRAYMLFVEAGRPVGRDVEFWLEAERQLSGGSED